MSGFIEIEVDTETGKFPAYPRELVRLFGSISRREIADVLAR